MEWAQVATLVAALAAFTGMQALWVARALDRLEARVDRVDARLGVIETLLRDQGERIARLEERGPGLRRV
jgi:HAMP domain-containing protein